MSSNKPSIPKGTRDFSPLEMNRRNYIFTSIRQVFEKFGYQPIETPAMENLSTLLGKYGEEGDKLLFKILNSGDFISKVSDELLAEKNSNKITSKIFFFFLIIIFLYIYYINNFKFKFIIKNERKERQE